MESIKRFVSELLPAHLKDWAFWLSAVFLASAITNQIMFFGRWQIDYLAIATLDDIAIDGLGFLILCTIWFIPLLIAGQAARYYVGRQLLIIAFYLRQDRLRPKKGKIYYLYFKIFVVLISIGFLCIYVGSFSYYEDDTWSQTLFESMFLYLFGLMAVYAGGTFAGSRLALLLMYGRTASLKGDNVLRRYFRRKSSGYADNFLGQRSGRVFAIAISQAVVLSVAGYGAPKNSTAIFTKEAELQLNCTSQRAEVLWFGQQYTLVKCTDRVLALQSTEVTAINLTAEK